MSSDFEKFGPPKAPVKATEKAESVFDILTQAFERAVGGLSKNLGAGFIAKLGTVSFLESITKLQSWTDSMVNANAASLGVKGGALAGFAEGLTKLDMRGLGVPEIGSLLNSMLSADGLQGMDVSRGDLGNLYANVPNMGRGAEGISMM